MLKNLKMFQMKGFCHYATHRANICSWNIRGTSHDIFLEYSEKDPYEIPGNIPWEMSGNVEYRNIL